MPRVSLYFVIRGNRDLVLWRLIRNLTLHFGPESCGTQQKQIRHIGPYFGPYFPFVGCPIFPLWAALCGMRVCCLPSALFVEATLAVAPFADEARFKVSIASGLLLALPCKLHVVFGPK